MVKRTKIDFIETNGNKKVRPKCAKLFGTQNIGRLKMNVSFLVYCKYSHLQ